MTAPAAFDHAMLLAAGLGKRMRPLTDTRPKPLVTVAGRTLADHVLDRLAAAGVRTAVVNVHHHADQMERHLAARTAPRIVISDERAGLLDSGGGVKKALPLLGKRPFVVCNSDSFWIEGPSRNLPRLFAAWDPDAMDILMLVAPTATSIGFDGPGDYMLDAFGRLERRRERAVAPFAYAGVLLIKPQLFQGMPDAFSLNRLFDAAEAKGRLHGRRLDGIWLHVGTPAAIDAAEAQIARSTMA
ncbi:nucleotidyltransferase family protein [Labrys wisconsinensis]|uniref:MurNAc alpha-1-phosphate uridylyltransferase n=1 Tax=Labrys wisconsinensis TaxID=425677 RepID=A0ABU0J1J6_9HYPH|nr:nucleotidyltransferase family protein [Labrys wisconsinensis]MDQ0468131.1 MurNAc alpha-1-phosphate uridylyltransferase [Labrys wisconsinensis]